MSAPLAGTPEIHIDCKPTPSETNRSLVLERLFQRIKAPTGLYSTCSVPNSPSPFSKLSPAHHLNRFHRASVTSAISEIQIQINDQKEVKFPNRFHKRLWRWIKSKTRRKANSSWHSVETHGKRKFCTHSVPNEGSLQVLEDHQRVVAGQRRGTACSQGSWADISLVSGQYLGDRRWSGSKCLVPPTTVRSTSRDTSMESGYHSRSSLSSPSTPRSLSARRRSSRGITAMKLSNNKSFSVDTGSSPPYTLGSERTFKNWRSVDNSSGLGATQPCQRAIERRKQFCRLNNVFHEVIEDDGSSGSESQDCTFEAVKQSLGEWQIPHAEITFSKKCIHGGTFGHDVFTGRWHGDVVIHSFRANASNEVKDYLKNIRTLTQIRHENIVLYMGASVVQDDMYNIVTNPVKAESLHSNLSTLNSPMDVEKVLSIAKQLSNAMGYLHAKDIIHGRISSRNVFLETKVQLSLLDYAVGQPNTIYSSPRVLTHPAAQNPQVHKGTTKADDIFAFGTLLFELFSSQLPLRGEPDNVKAARIRAGTLPQCLAHLHCTDRLKRLIHKCWEYEEKRRPSFAQMVPHFSPGSGILRRHSSSEPRMDQIGKPINREINGSLSKNTCTSIQVCVGISEPTSSPKP